jgi:hypothetical protein
MSIRGRSENTPDDLATSAGHAQKPFRRPLNKRFLQRLAPGISSLFVCRSWHGNIKPILFKRVWVNVVTTPANGDSWDYAMRSYESILLLSIDLRLTNEVFFRWLGDRLTSSGCPGLELFLRSLTNLKTLEFIRPFRSGEDQGDI